jgi:hypothetical protein
MFACMRFACDPLVFKALCAVDEACEQAQADIVRPSFALRFALAYLYVRSDGTRWVYDAFWKAIQDADIRSNGGYLRGTSATSAMQGIMRSVGVVPTFETLQVLQHARARNSADAIARRRLAKAMRDEAALRSDADEERRAKLRDGLS